jgi:hypothetical protein
MMQPKHPFGSAGRAACLTEARCHQAEADLGLTLLESPTPSPSLRALLGVGRLEPSPQRLHAAVSPQLLHLFELLVLLIVFHL